MAITSEAVRACEAILNTELEYNRAHSIWPSVNRVMEVMLTRRGELTDAYEELYSSLSQHPHALRSFLDIVAGSPRFWGPERIMETREARKELTEINVRIAEAAEALSTLLARRNEIKEVSGFSCDTFYHVLDPIKVAAEEDCNHLFEWHIQEPLDALKYQYDLKYWPNLSSVIEAIGIDAEAAEINAGDTVTASATSSSRPGLSDFLRALLAQVEENLTSEGGHIPLTFRISDTTLASLVNCVLELKVEEIIDAAYVKRFRQGERQRKKRLDISN